MQLEGNPDLVQITLGVLEVIEQQSLLVSIEAADDASHWRHVVDFPQQFYPGVSAVLVRPAASLYLRARWTVSRWGRGDHTPRFRLYATAEALTVSQPQLS